MIRRKEFQKTTEEMLHLSATRIPSDVKNALERAKKREKKAAAKKQLENILKNLEIARRKNVPLCQDTGIPIFFIKVGREIELDFDINKALKKSIRTATNSVPLRPNVVDPLNRKNSGDNTSRGHPITHLTILKEKKFEIELMLKGAGSENWSRLFMLKPSKSKENIKQRILETVKQAGGQICPPSIIGVGIGGTAEKATLLAKKSLLRPLDEEKKEGELVELEKDITKSVNDLGIGPMGLGGKTTTLGTRIEKAGCHTASLPVALNFQCWAARRAKARLEGENLKIEVPK